MTDWQTFHETIKTWIINNPQIFIPNDSHPSPLPFGEREGVRGNSKYFWIELTWDLMLLILGVPSALCPKHTMEDGSGGKKTGEARTHNTMRGSGIMTDLKEAWDRSLMGRS